MSGPKRTAWDEWCDWLNRREEAGEEIDPRNIHTEHVEQLDRQTDKAPYGAIHLEQPRPRERQLHFQERAARNDLRPRTGHVDIQPVRRCECGAIDKGYPYPGHRYSCRSYAKHARRAT